VVRSFSISCHVYAGSIFFRDIFGKEELSSKINEVVSCSQFYNPCYVANKVKRTEQKQMEKIDDIVPCTARRWHVKKKIVRERKF
jgi:hypothetical protein